MKFIDRIWPVLVSLGFMGCGPAPVSQGTQGVIHSGPIMLQDVLVTVYQARGNRTEAIGSGVSDLQGQFGLVREKAAGPLWLEPGEYSITLESNGPVPFAWPAEYQDPLRTPLKRDWTTSDQFLELDVPEPQPSGQ
jgi:hypothetical protein